MTDKPSFFRRLLHSLAFLFPGYFNRRFQDLLARLDNQERQLDAVRTDLAAMRHQIQQLQHNTYADACVAREAATLQDRQARRRHAELMDRLSRPNGD